MSAAHDYVREARPAYSIVTLNREEMLQGAMVGVMRHVNALYDDRRDFYGAAMGEGFQMHAEGALGEMAFGKFSGLYWSAGTFRGVDVTRFDVRTARGHSRRLIIHQDDPDDRDFVLVTYVGKEWRVHGWIHGSDAKDQAWYQDPTGNNRHAYFVPQHALRRFAMDGRGAPIVDVNHEAYRGV